MLKKIIFVLITLSLTVPSFAQNSINDYKYVVVPLQFDFLKGKDKYRTSTLTRYLFKNEGFEVYFDEEELPKELFNDRCLALYADVLKSSSFLKNKVQIELKDCYGNVIFLSQKGSTKVKEFADAYPIVIKEAFKSIKALNYAYKFNPNVGYKKQTNATSEQVKNTTEETQKAQAEVQRLKQEVEDLKKQKELAKAIADKEIAEKEKVKQLDLKKEKNKSSETILQEENLINTNLLYAQPIDNGFQLVDASPKVVMVITKTAAPNVFTVKGKDAIVFKEDNTWYYSENDTKTKLNIKF
ncbi:hypothetical protein ACFQ1Q_11455 [Winogradskyella litorisediminis]|uniref:Uncharacterized protein n=1 Tax=Winogradskyella litorisediminis TaxID=1156618 RepID=A0ABW3N8A5_9FLAO